MDTILDLTALELGKKIKEKEISVREAAEASLAKIKEADPELNCYITVAREELFKKAEIIQKQIDDKVLAGPLAGVPAAVKDNMCTRGLRTTCGSKMLENFVPAYTAQAVVNLEKAGALILGKTNMDEFAMGSTTETSFFGPAKNPWNKDHVPGGSIGRAHV